MRPRFLNNDEFAQVVRNAPPVAIDLIIRDPEQHVLVGLRMNEPAKGKWFVPGGAVRKCERLADAFARIVKAEIGLEASIGDAKFIPVRSKLGRVSLAAFARGYRQVSTSNRQVQRMSRRDPEPNVSLQTQPILRGRGRP